MAHLAVKQNLFNMMQDVTDNWKSFDLTQVNGNQVRVRVMENVTAQWHSHSDSDEFFYVLEGVVNIDTESGTQVLNPNELFVVPAKTKHRARVTGRATLLVIDKIQ